MRLKSPPSSGSSQGDAEPNANEGGLCGQDLLPCIMHRQFEVSLELNHSHASKTFNIFQHSPVGRAAFHLNGIHVLHRPATSPMEL